MKNLLVSVKGNSPNERKISVFFFFFCEPETADWKKNKKKNPHQNRKERKDNNTKDKTEGDCWWAGNCGRKQDWKKGKK